MHHKIKITRPVTLYYLAGGQDGQKITFNVIKQRLGDLIYKVAC